MVAEAKMMDIKKIQQSSIEASISKKRAATFIQEVKSEVEKVTWTTKDELSFYTKVVILSTLLFGLSIYGLDLLIQSFLNSLSLILRFISG